MEMSPLEDAEERGAIMEKLALVSVFFPKVMQKDKTFLRDYTNKYPFGCRSTLTCANLKRLKIPSYFSSCLTLTSTYQGSVLYNDGSPPHLNGLPFLDPASANFTGALEKAKLEKDLVLLVDVVDPSALPPLPANHRYLKADIPKAYPRSCQTQSERIDYCYRLLSQYANHAKVVITSRIHVGLPAAALGTPVIFVSKSGWLPGGKEKTGRVSGLLDIFHRIDKPRNLTIGFDLSGPIPPNPGNHEADRRRAAFWHRLKRVSYYEDAAKIFGRIPLQRLGSGMIQDDLHNNFHFVMNQTDLNDWRSRRVIESVLFHHPNAEISIHVEGYVQGDSEGEFSIFAESGYRVSILAISSQSASVEQIKLLLQRFGGVFLSKSTFIRGSLPIALNEGYSLDEHGDVAMMIGKKGLTVMETTSKWISTYLTSAETQQCMLDPTWLMKSTDAIAVTLHRAAFQEHEIIMDSQCYNLIEKDCIYNNDLHWKYGPASSSMPLHQTTEGTAAQQQNRTERQKKAGQSQIQLSHTSAMNRYPDEYSAVQTYFRTEMSDGISDSDGTKKKKKMLSFGAATGEEAITLASMYFSNSTFTVYGVDLDEGSLETAKTSAAAHSPKLDDGKIIFFNGQDTDLSKHGPYDAIFANSVLCYHGTPGVNPQSILTKYPFAAFEDSLGYLDANLNVGGVLAIVNTNYHMSDTKLHTRYKILAQCKNFVPKVDAESISYEKKKSDGMYDCVWVKQEAGEKQ